MDGLLPILLFFAIVVAYFLIRDGLFHKVFDPHVHEMRRVKKHVAAKRSLKSGR